jgi:hypothetical protein
MKVVSLKIRLCVLAVTLCYVLPGVYLHDHFRVTNGDSLDRMRAWTFIVFGYDSILYILWGITIFYIGRKNRIPKPIMVATAMNSVLSWFLLSLSQITNDYSEYMQLANVGLGKIHWVFMLLGISSILAAIYILRFGADLLAKNIPNGNQI